MRDNESLGQEMVPKGVGGRGGREGKDAFWPVAQKEVDGQAPALAGRSGGGLTKCWMERWRMTGANVRG